MRVKRYTPEWFATRYVVEDRGHTTPCWIWTLRRNGHGYGLAEPKRLAHRLYYEHYVGPIPKGLTIDHLCRVRNCVNPDHMEPVTQSENCRRGNLARPPRTHCINGHPLDEANTYRPPNEDRRVCRICVRERGGRYRAKQAAKRRAEAQLRNTERAA